MRPQPPLDPDLIFGRKEMRVKRAALRRELGLPAELGDFGFGVSEVQMEQRCGRLDARVDARGAENREAQHSLIEHHVAGIHLDHQVRARVDAARVNIRSVKESGDDRLRCQDCW